MSGPVLSTSCAPPPAYETESSDAGLGCGEAAVYGTPCGMAAENDDDDSVPDVEAMLDVFQGRLLALERIATLMILDAATRQSGDTYKARVEKLQHAVISSAQHMELPITENAERVQESFGKALRVIFENAAAKASVIDNRSPEANDRAG